MSLVQVASTIINNKPYLYWTHFFPHDAGATESTGASVASTIQSVIKGNVQVIKNAWPGSVDKGIFFVRTIFGRLRFNISLTGVGFSHLCQYRRKWNKRDGQFDNIPNHDEHSHAADAFRYLAMAICNRMTRVESYSSMLPVYEWTSIMNAVMGRWQVYEWASLMPEYR
jgi:phage terminase large subunit